MVFPAEILAYSQDDLILFGGDLMFCGNTAYNAGIYQDMYEISILR